MRCVFDQCELWSGIGLGIISGLISTFIFWIIQRYSVAYFYYRKTYGKLAGIYKGQGYKKDNPGELDDTILSTAAVKHLTENKLEISVTHNNLTWIGEITMSSIKYGTIVFQYTDHEHKHFFGFKRLIVDGDLNVIYVIGDETKGYGTEVFTRINR